MSVIRAYTLEQAASIANISPWRARSWARHGVVVPSILYAPAKSPQQFLYDFTDLVGLRTLGTLRDKHDLSLQSLRKAHEYLREHASKPWSELRLWVRGKKLFFTPPDSQEIQSAHRAGQQTFAIEIEPVARSVRDAADVLAKRNPSDIGKTEKHRAIQNNRLVVKGTRIPVESIISLFEDGYSPQRIVDAYPSLTLADVEQILKEHGQAAVA